MTMSCVGLVIWAFSLAVYCQAQSSSQELHNGAIAIVDEDNSPLSRYIIEGFYLPPYFKPPQIIPLHDVNRLMDNGTYTFILDIPLHFERDVLAGRQPAIQVNVDATVMVQAGIGAGYIQQILTTQINEFLSRSERLPPSPVNLAIRVAFNPNVATSWFTSVMGIINNVTMLAIILSGAAVVREREHGTMDHLLVMPVTPFEIAMSKVWANGLVITHRGRPFAECDRAWALGYSGRGIRCFCFWWARRFISSLRRRSAFFWQPWPARCRSLASSISSSRRR